jgi:O-antigen/teichoic acid export membrane protein
MIYQKYIFKSLCDVLISRYLISFINKFYKLFKIEFIMEIKEKLKNKIIKNSLWGFIATMVSKIGGLFLTIILARFLMPEGYGIYSLVLSVAMIFCTLSDLGLSQTLVRYLSFSLVKDRVNISNYHFYLLKLKLKIISIVSLIFFILAYPLAFYIFKNPTLFPLFLIAAVYIFVLSFEGFYNSVFYSIEKIKYISLKESISQILRVTLVLILFLIVSASYQKQLIGLFIVLTLNSFIILILILYYLKKLIPELFKKSKTSKKIDHKKIKNFLKYVGIASISGIFFSYIDSIMLGLYVAPEYIGYYRAAASLIFGIIGILSFLNFILLSLFTKLDIKDTKTFLINSIKYSSIITIPSSLGLFILGKYFIRVFYGVNYLSSAFPFYILSLLIFPVVSIGILRSLFTAEEKPKIFTKLVLIVGFLNIILNFIFIKTFLLVSPEWATFGAALATLISWIIYFLAAVHFIKKQFNFKISLRILFKPFIASLIMVFILTYALKHIPQVNLLKGALVIFLGILVYILALILIGGVSKKELIYFYNSIKN